jgi:hypothetical protein
MAQAGRKVVGDPTSEPLDEDAIFWVCSQTKLVTTVSASRSGFRLTHLCIQQIAALQLIEQGKIELTTHVSQILPELANPVIVTARDAEGKPTATTPAKNPITLGQLLNHTSGMEYNLDGTPFGTSTKSTTHAFTKDEDSATFFRLNKVFAPAVG